MIVSCTARKILRPKISAKDSRVSEIRPKHEQTPIDSPKAESMLSLSLLILEQTLLGIRTCFCVDLHGGLRD